MDDKECDAMTLKAASWFSKAMEQLSCTAPVEVTSTECKKLVKDKLVVLLNESFHLARFQNEKLQQMKMAIGSDHYQEQAYRKSAVGNQSTRAGDRL